MSRISVWIEKNDTHIRRAQIVFSGISSQLLSKETVSDILGFFIEAEFRINIIIFTTLLLDLVQDGGYDLDMTIIIVCCDINMFQCIRRRMLGKRLYSTLKKDFHDDFFGVDVSSTVEGGWTPT